VQARCNGPVCKVDILDAGRSSFDRVPGTHAVLQGVYQIAMFNDVTQYGVVDFVGIESDPPETLAIPYLHRPELGNAAVIQLRPHTYGIQNARRGRCNRVSP
jgi:hypothetical protein